jgi:hypothetical protein
MSLEFQASSLKSSIKPLTTNLNGLTEMERKNKLIIEVHVLPNFQTGYIQSLVTSSIGHKSKTEENKLNKLRF